MTKEQVVGIIRDAAEKKRDVIATAKLLGMTPRTVWRKIARYRKWGPEGLVHGLKGKPSNRAFSSQIREEVFECYRQLPEHISFEEFSRAIAEQLGIAVSRETVRQWLIDAGMWTGRKG